LPAQLLAHFLGTIKHRLLVIEEVTWVALQTLGAQRNAAFIPASSASNAYAGLAITS
jgi:hypothetical protein